MRLYYLSNSFIPSRQANSIQVMKMCQAFARFAQHVALFCRKAESDEEGDSQIYRYYGVAESFELIRLDIPPVRVIRRLLYAFAVIRRLRRDPNSFLLFGRDYYVLGLISIFRLVNRPMGLEIHQPPTDRLQHFLQRRIFSNPNFKRLVVISQALADEYLRLYGKLLEGKITVAHDGADTHQIPAEILSNPAYHQRGAAFRLGYIGSLYPGKGMELIAQLAPLAPDCEFHVVGGRPEDIARWQEACPSGNLVFHGFVQPERVYEFMAEFDVLLAPYQPNVLVGDRKVDIARWMSPLKLFEYMAGGKPIIATDLPVLREVVAHRENALLARAETPEEWVRCIRELQGDELLRRRLGTQAQRDFFSHYTWEKRAELILQSMTQRKPVREKVV